MTIRRDTPFPSRQECDLEAFAALVEQPLDPADYPLADRITQGVPTYDASALAHGPTADAEHRAALRDELSRALVEGPGIVLLESAVPAEAVDRASQVFWDLIAAQHAQGGPAGDHFAKPGTNDRVWNALEKLAVTDPEAFIDYHRSDAVAVACEAWLGPRYQLTEQVNVVNPGGEAQHPHRDYHMGFLTDDEAEQFPRHAHLLSPLLTLQGAIAHCDMGTETGPTMYLPHSHKYELGYLAWRRPEFIEYFAQHRVQLPLRTGDAVFFSPAMFHAAGHNRTADVHRMANLLQISSAFGRATEAVDRARMVHAVYPRLRSRLASGLDRAAAANVVACCAEGYAFPTNLDRDQPVDGLAPPSQADLMIQGLDEDWTPERLSLELYLHGERHRSAVGEDPPLFGADEDGGPAIAESAPPEPALVGGSLGQAARLTVDELLAQARSGLRRFAPEELATKMESATAPGPDGPLVVIDIRDRDDRERTGMIPGSASIPLIVLEWRCHPSASYSHPAVESFDQPLVVVCNEGYTSSLAAASLRRLGFSDVSDLEGGIEAWSAAGLLTTEPTEPKP
ncbi:MAG: phytanoyl-CoA dioxygenase family protein [Acidimicrobiaceae bacterium]|nr:phytanoyl-CoA dioxygenase family protein [Acidimicrobiaceae bacterium]